MNSKENNDKCNCKVCSIAMEEMDRMIEDHVKDDKIKEITSDYWNIKMKIQIEKMK